MGKCMCDGTHVCVHILGGYRSASDVVTQEVSTLCLFVFSTLYLFVFDIESFSVSWTRAT